MIKFPNATYGNDATKSAAYYQDIGLAKRLATYSPWLAVELQHNTLEWDKVGNLELRRETGGGTWIQNYFRSRDIQERFYYDHLNRLESWVTSGDFNANESPTYDAIDNIRSKSGVGRYLYGILTSDGSGSTLQFKVVETVSQTFNCVEVYKMRKCITCTTFIKVPKDMQFD